MFEMKVFLIIFVIISFLGMIGDKNPDNKKMYLAAFVITLLPVLLGRW